MTVCLIRADAPHRQLVLYGRQSCGLFLLALGESHRPWQAYDEVRLNLVQNYFGVPKQMRANYVSLKLYKEGADKLCAVLEECAAFKMREAGRLLDKVRKLYVGP
jgi:hypothetical protein